MRLLSALLAALLMGLTSVAADDRKDASDDPLPEGALVRFGTARQRHPGPYVHRLAFSPDGKLLATAGSGNSVGVIDTATGKVVRRLTPGSHPRWTNSGSPGGEAVHLYAVAFSPDGKLIAAGGKGEVTVWRTDTWEPHLRLPTDGAAKHLWFDGEANTLVGLDNRFVDRPLPGDRNTAVCRWDLATGKEVARGGADVSGGMYGVAVPASPDGRYIQVGGGSGKLNVLDLRTMKTKTYGFAIEYREGQRVPNALSHDAKFFVATTGLVARDLETEKVVPAGKTPPPFANLYAHALTPDGKRLFALGTMSRGKKATGYETVLFAHDLPGGREALKSDDVPAEAGDYLTYRLQASPDGKLLAVAARSFVDLWDAAGLKRLDRVGGAEAAVSPATVAQFSADGKRLLTFAANEGVGRIWDAETGKLVTRTGRVGAVAMTTDGKRFAAVERDFYSSLKIYDADTGKGLETCVDKVGNSVSHLVFSRGDKFLLGFVPGGYAELSYDLDAKKFATDKKEKVGRQFIEATGDGAYALFTPINRGMSGPVPMFGEPSPVLAPLDPRGGRAVHLPKVPPGYIQKAMPTVSPDGRMVAMHDQEEHEIWLHDAEGPPGVKRVMPRRAPERSALAVGPGGKLLAVGGANMGHVEIWDVAARKLKGVLNLNVPGSSLLKFSAAGDRLLCAATNGELLLCDPSKLSPPPKPDTPPTAEQIRKAWGVLGASIRSTDWADARWDLIAGGNESVKFLGEKLREIAALEEQDVRNRMHVAESALKVVVAVGTPEAKALLKELAELPRTNPIQPKAAAAMKELEGK